MRLALGILDKERDMDEWRGHKGEHRDLYVDFLCRATMANIQ